MKVGLFIPCYINAIYPNVGVASYRLLKSLGVDVDYPLDQTCCGQPMANAGFEDESMKLALRFDDLFREYDYIVGPSASCVAFVKENHPGILEKEGHVCQSAGKIYDICEFIHDVLKPSKIPARFPHKVSIHNSCHGVRELLISAPTELNIPYYNKLRDLLKHSKAAEKFLQDSKMAAWHNETLWMVRAKRDKMSKEVPEWEELRNKACELKLYSNSHLEELLLEFEKNATANGAIVHWAKDADEYCAIVYEILNEHNVHHFIKSKSMLAEECGLNPFLMERGIDVVESDLGERILQLMHLEPSHIVLPAIHIKREQVGELFEKEMGTEKGNFDPTYLTHAARKNLRHLFLNAEAAMTGANFAVASTGDIVVCTNEGNADMGTSYPKLNIAAFGMEKIVPDLDALGVFTRLLARSATGQPVTTYTSHYRRPREGGEYHIIIVDNGRSALLSKPDHIKTLNCIRCGACMNTCPVYRRSGGYSYTYFIPGPIGINLGMAHAPEKYFDNLSACSLCMSCSDVCPVKVDLAEQIYKWRQDLDGLGKANTGKKIMSGGMKFLMERPALFNAALWAAPVVNGLPRFMKYNDLDDWGKGRELPEFASESFNEMWKKNKVQGKEESK